MTVEEKKLKLETFVILIDRVEVLRAELEDMRARAVALTQNISDLPQGTIDGSKPERALESIERSIKKLIQEETAACETIDCVITAISKLSDTREQQIMSLKYIGEKKGNAYKRYVLWEIAVRMGYSLDRIKQLHGSALRNLQL